MRGVDYTNTSYRRMYQPTAAFKLLGCEAQSVYWALRQVLNPAGRFDLDGAKAAEALAVEVGWSLDDVDFIDKGLQRLIDREWVFYDEDQNSIYEPDFHEAEHATKSGKLRTRECRQRQRGGKPKPVRRPAPSRPKTTAPKPTPKTTAPTTPKRPPLRVVASIDETATNATAKRRAIGFQIEDDPAYFDGETLEQAARGGVSIDSADSTDESESPSLPQTAPTPPVFEDPANYGFEIVESPENQPVTKRYAPVTDRFEGVTNFPSQYPLPIIPIPNHQAAASMAGPRRACAHARARDADPPRRHDPETESDPDAELCAWELVTLAEPDPDAEPDVWQLVDADEAFWCEPAKPEPESGPGQAAAGGQGDERPSFQSFASQVEDIFARASRAQRRLLNSAEQRLARDWYDAGVDLRLLEETLTAKAATARERVLSLIYFRDPVREARERPAAPPPQPAGVPQPPDDAFSEFARLVEASFQRQVNSTRSLSPAEHSLLRDWFAQGVDVQLIDATFAECIDAAQGRRIGSLIYFRNPVETAWRERLDLHASQRSAAPPPPDGELARRLDDLIARIPTTVRDYELLVETIAKLRPRADREPQAVEDRLRRIEERYLARIGLSEAQERQLQDMLNFLAFRMPTAELTKHKEKLSIQLKQAGVGLPTLTLFNH